MANIANISKFGVHVEFFPQYDRGLERMSGVKFNVNRGKILNTISFGNGTCNTNFVTSHEGFGGWNTIVQNEDETFRMKVSRLQMSLIVELKTEFEVSLDNVERANMIEFDKNILGYEIEKSNVVGLSVELKVGHCYVFCESYQIFNAYAKKYVKIRGNFVQLVYVENEKLNLSEVWPRSSPQVLGTETVYTIFSIPFNIVHIQSDCDLYVLCTSLKSLKLLYDNTYTHLELPELGEKNVIQQLHEILVHETTDEDMANQLYVNLLDNGLKFLQSSSNNDDEEIDQDIQLLEEVIAIFGYVRVCYTVNKCLVQNEELPLYQRLLDCLDNLVFVDNVAATIISILHLVSLLPMHSTIFEISQVSYAIASEMHGPAGRVSRQTALILCCILGKTTIDDRLSDELLSEHSNRNNNFSRACDRFLKISQSEGYESFVLASNTALE